MRAHVCVWPGLCWKKRKRGQQGASDAVAKAVPAGWQRPRAQCRAVTKGLESRWGRTTAVGADGPSVLKRAGAGAGGGGVGTRPWWLALLACGGAYWPLAFEPSAMTSRHPYYCGHPHCRGHPPSCVGIQNATSAHGVLPWRPDQCPVCGHHEDPRLGGAHHNQQRECHTRPWVLAHQCVTCS